MRWWEITYTTQPPFTEKVQLIATDEKHAWGKFTEKGYKRENAKNIKELI